MELIALPVGVAVGVVLGLLGAGGSLLTVPALTLLLGLSALEATSTSLVAVAMMAVAGLVVHRRAGRCSCRQGLVFGGVAAVLAAGVGWLASGLPEQVLTVAFVVVLLGTAAWLLRHQAPGEEGPGEGGPTPGASGEDEAEVHEPDTHVGPTTIAAGGGVGALTGLLGVGGGFVIVPALVATHDMPMRIAVGTSQVVVLVSALAGLLGRAQSGSVEWGLGLLFGAGGVVGAAVGAQMADRVAASVLRRSFAVVAVAVAVVMLLQST